MCRYKSLYVVINHYLLLYVVIRRYIQCRTDFDHLHAKQRLIKIPCVQFSGACAVCLLYASPAYNKCYFALICIIFNPPEVYCVRYYPFNTIICCRKDMNNFYISQIKLKYFHNSRNEQYIHYLRCSVSRKRSTVALSPEYLPVSSLSLQVSQ